MEPQQAEEEMITAFDSVCRLCASRNERFVGIFDEEGAANGLADKMNLYLPVKVSEGDSLPLRCCWSCASTVLAWHELVVVAVETDRRLREEIDIIPLCRLDVKSAEDDEEPVSYTVDFNLKELSATTQDNDDDETGADPEMADASLTAFCHTTEEEAPAPSPPPSGRRRHKATRNKRRPKPRPPETAEDKVLVKQPEPSPDNCAVKSDDLFNIPQQIEVFKDEVKFSPDEELSCEKDQDAKDDAYSFRCQHCDDVFVLEDEVIGHVRREHPEKAGLLLQRDDSERSAAKRRRNTKIDQDQVNAAKVMVEGRVYYNCKICGKSLHSPYTYIWHMRIHTGERPFVCDLCGKQFRVSQGLVRHLRETHEGIKNFPCDLCGRMFATRRNVEEHRRIHTNERPYICDLCGKAFKQKASLFVHSRSHTDTFPFRCSYCDQGFRTKPPLMIHVTRHTGEKPYPCDVCGRCFRIKYELKRHRLIHSDEKPFSCVDCGLSFRQKRYLRNHNKINHNNRTVA